MRRWTTLTAAVAVIALGAVLAAAQDEDGETPTPETTTTTTTTLAYRCEPTASPDVRVIRQADAPARILKGTGTDSEDATKGIAVDYAVPETAGELRILLEIDECHPPGGNNIVHYTYDPPTRPHHASGRDFSLNGRVEFRARQVNATWYRSTQAELRIDIYDNDDELEHLQAQNQRSHHLYASRPFCAEFLRLIPHPTRNAHLGEVDEIIVAIIGNRPDCAGRY